MEKFVYVYDDLFPPEMVNRIEDVIFNNLKVKNFDISPHWKFENGLSNGNSNDYGLSYSFTYADSNIVEDNSFFYLNPLYYFTHKIKIDLLRVKQTRMWLQFPSNNSPEIHHDATLVVDGKNSYPDPLIGILLYYVNDSEGDTVLYKEDNHTELKRVSPKKGRCIFFSNQIPHKAGVPINTPRSVINYNFYFS